MTTNTSQVRTIRPLDRPRPFNPSEKALIRKVHGYMPTQQLLEVLNDRLVADLGPGHPKHTMEQLYQEIGEVDTKPAGDHDWSSLRQLVAKARRSGLLDVITKELIDDFAVVFSLTPAQVLRLHDVLLKAKEGDD